MVAGVFDRLEFLSAGDFDRLELLEATGDFDCLWLLAKYGFVIFSAGDLERPGFLLVATGENDRLESLASGDLEAFENFSIAGDLERLEPRPAFDDLERLWFLAKGDLERLWFLAVNGDRECLGFLAKGDRERLALRSCGDLERPELLVVATGDLDLLAFLARGDLDRREELLPLEDDRERRRRWLVVGDGRRSSDLRRSGDFFRLTDAADDDCLDLVTDRDLRFFDGLWLISFTSASRSSADRFRSRRLSSL